MKAPLIEWRTLEYPLRERNADWFVVVAIIAFAVAVTSVILGNILFAILVVVGTAALLLYAARIPQEIDIQLTEKGVAIDGALYKYEGLQAFFINEDEGRIFFRTGKVLMPVLVFHLEDAPAAKVREYLSEYLPEEKIEETFLEKLVEHLGF